MLYRKILLAYDGSDNALSALEHAAELARALGARLHALWVSEPPPDDAMFVDVSDAVRVEMQDKHRLAVQARFHALEEKIMLVGAAVGTVVQLDHRSFHQAAVAIVEHAVEGKFDLIILGNEEHTTFWERVLGHTDGRVTHEAPCDVLTVRQRHVPPEGGIGQRGGDISCGSSAIMSRPDPPSTASVKTGIVANAPVSRAGK